jgi:uroporphyrinogen decarboxylase
LIPGFETEVLEEDERTMVMRHADGRVTRALKEGMVRGQRMSMDTYLRFPVESRDDFVAVKRRYNPDSPARYPAFWDDYAELLQERSYPVQVPLLTTDCQGFYSCLRNWMGTEAACTVFYDDPAWAEEMCEFIADTIIAVCRRVVESVDVDYFLWHEDYAFKTGPLLSPRIVRKFLLPQYRRVNDFMRAHGVDIIFIDTDGDPRVLIPLLLESGINGILPLECAAGQDPVALRKEYGHDLLLWGGIDKRALAQDRAAIERELLAKIPPLMADGGYIPTVDHAVPPDVPYDNFIYYMDLKLKILEGRLGG